MLGLNSTQKLTKFSRKTYGVDLKGSYAEFFIFIGMLNVVVLSVILPSVMAPLFLTYNFCIPQGVVEEEGIVMTNES
jgi:hypothetical protein